MALNFSHRPVFPGHLSEENLVSPIRIANGCLLEGIPEKNQGGYGRPWHSYREVQNPFDFGMDRFDRVGSQDSVSNDMLDLLPSDPFGMDISTTVTALTGWLEDLEVDYGGYGGDEAVASDGSYQLFAELNVIWSEAMRCQGFPSSAGINGDHKSNIQSELSWSSVDEGGAGASCVVDFGSSSSENCTPSFRSGSWGVDSTQRDNNNAIFSNEDGGAPNGGLLFALGHMGVRDLLVFESVCKSLQSAIRGDPFLWTTIHIEQPLNEKLTDDILLHLTNRAQGNLKCLSLVECPRITDDCLRRVLESNPKLTKLSVPGCTRLTIEGIMNSLRAFNSSGTQGVKHLRIGGIYGVTPKLFGEMKVLLGTDDRIDGQMQQSARKPRFHIRGSLYLPSDDDREIDIETCPRCQNHRLVYDCPAETCQGKDHATQLCRACTLCIPRCVKCGRCITDNEYEETFCLELLCFVCWHEVKKLEENQNGKLDLILSKSAVPVEQNHSFSLHG